MHEPATLSRRALAALPIALAGASRPAPAAVPTQAGAGDAALLDLGRRWQAACAALHAHDVAVMRLPAGEAMTDEMEALGDRLFAEEHPLFAAAMEMRPRTLRGLAIKGQMLARAFDILAPDGGALEAAIDRAGDMQTHAALTLALDVLKLARLA